MRLRRRKTFIPMLLLAKKMLCAETTLYESGIVDVILSKDIQCKKKVSLLSYQNFQCDVLLESEKNTIFVSLH